MENFSIHILFIASIPEGIAIILGIYLLLGRKPDFKKVLIMGISIGTINYATRLLPLLFGIHTLISFFITLIAAFQFLRLKLGEAIKICIISYITRVVTETLGILTVIYVLKREFDLSDVFFVLYSSTPFLILGLILQYLLGKLLNKK